MDAAAFGQLDRCDAGLAGLGQVIYTGRGDETPDLLALHGISIEAWMAQEPTGRNRDLRLDFAVHRPDTNSQRIHVRDPGGASYLFVEYVFKRAG